MRCLVVGLGNIGTKRRAALGDRCVATVDPANPAADFRTVEDVDVDYDAAILSTPNAPKLDLMRYFLSRGKHVLVEKPLLFTEAEFSELHELAKTNGVIWQQGFNHRYEPMVQGLKAKLPEIGMLYHARLFYGNGTLDNGHDAPAHEELGCHLVDLVGFLFGYRGPVARIGKGEHAALLSLPAGALMAEVSYVSWLNTFAIEAWGDEGSLHVIGLRKWGPVRLIQRHRSRPSGVPHEELRIDSGPDITWKAEIDAFEENARMGIGSYENDRWIAECLR